MKYETKIIKGKFTEVWEEMIQDDYELVYFSETHLISFWKKEVKRTMKQKDCKNTKEFTEFIGYYKKNITINWAYVSTLWRKYDIVLEKNKHQDIMENLALYKIHLATHKQKPPCQPATYLNWNRFLEKWEVIKTTVENKWQDDIMKERGYTVEQIKVIQWEVKAYEQKHNREITRWTWENVVKYALTWEISS